MVSHLECPIDGDNPELVGEAGLEPLHHDGVLVQLVLRLDPLGLLLLPANKESVLVSGLESGVH